MTLLSRCAELALDELSRDEIAAELLLDRQTIDWLMDSDSFAVVLERERGARGLEDSREDS
jgi:orotate phosphoribosyltransferase-like protein